MSRMLKLLLLVVGLAVVLPVVPSTADAATEQAPHVRRRRVRRVVPPPPPPPPHVHRRRVIHAAPAYAPAPRPRAAIADPVSSIYFGLGPVGNFLVEGDEKVSQMMDSGGGLELFLGFRFSRYAAFELGGLFTFHGTQDQRIETGLVNAVTGDIKVFFIPSSRRIEPFIQLGAGAYILTRDGWDGNELTGGGFQLGGGVDLRINEMIAIGTRILWRGAFLDNSEAMFWYDTPYENTFLNMFTLSANLQIHF